MENKRYIGGSVNVQRRLWRHKSELRSGCHPCVRLQEDFALIGENHFDFEILEYVTTEDGLRRAEHRYINRLGEQDYNVRNVRMEPSNDIGSIAWVREMQRYINCIRPFVRNVDVKNEGRLIVDTNKHLTNNKLCIKIRI